MRAEDHMIPNYVTDGEIHDVKVMLTSPSWKVLQRMFRNQAATMLIDAPSKENTERAEVLDRVANLDKDSFQALIDEKLSYSPIRRGGSESDG